MRSYLYHAFMVIITHILMVSNVKTYMSHKHACKVNINHASNCLI